MTGEHRSPVLFLVRIIGILLLIIGALLFSTGAFLHFVGGRATQRYQSSAGELLRAFSRQDQTYFSYARVTVHVGQAIKVMGIFVFAAGGFVLWAPHVFCYAVVRMRREGKICAQQESNLQPTD